MDTKIVACIAKYNENIAWIHELNVPVILYNKGSSVDISSPTIQIQTIPNVGREAETYLRYILDHYSNLPEYTVFLQGNPFDHINMTRETLLSTINTKDATYTSVFPLNNVITENHNMHNTKSKKSFETLFDTPLPQYQSFPPGAQYIVPRNCITSRPYEFYKKIHDCILEKDDGTLVCPWTLERMWPHIFNPSIPSKDFSIDNLKDVSLEV